ncbi:MAG: transcriptional antiterminator [Idiomarina sp.]|nr:MAG: transcriptional antiterminator [Idiomarina sp.]
MTDAVKIKGFSEDTWINSIGQLFRYNDSGRWFIDIRCHPPKDNGRNYLLLSQAPILVRKRKLNASKPYQPSGQLFKFVVDDLREWGEDHLKNCAALDWNHSNEQHVMCFVNRLENGVTIYLPQFELARALFFHTAYFARASLQHKVLDTEFNVQRYDHDEETARINVLKYCQCPAGVFTNPIYRRFLAWLILDPDARMSFESISDMQIQLGKSNDTYRSWNFRFLPPMLSGAELTIRGNYDPDTKTYLVYEVIGISGIKANVPAQVEFYSPKFFIPEHSGGHGEGGENTRPGEHIVDEDEEASGDNEAVMLEAIKSELGFAKAFETQKVAKDTRQVGSSSNGEAKEASNIVSTEGQGLGGSTPAADWDGLEDTTEDMHLYESRFESFHCMLEQLQEKHGYRVDRLAHRKLPAVDKCKMHLMRQDSTPRCWVVARVSIGDQYAYLMEIDTSDAAKALSTKVISGVTTKQLIDSLREIEKKIIKSSLTWPNNFLKRHFKTLQHSYIVHPASNKLGAINHEHIERWAVNVSNNLKKFLNALPSGEKD